MAADGRPKHGFLDWVKDHPGVAIAVIPGALAIVKVMFASNFVLTTQLAVASSSNPLTILTGTLVSLLPVATVLVLAASIVAFFTQGPGLRELGFLGALLSLYAAVNMPLVTRLLPAAVSFLAVAGVVWLLFRDRSIPEKSALVGGLLLLVTTATTGVWLPLESIEGRDGRMAVGYVLDDGNDPLPILLREDRRVVFLAKADVVDRRHCRTRDVSRSIIDFMLRRDPRANEIDRCPEIELSTRKRLSPSSAAPSPHPTSIEQHSPTPETQ